MDSSVIVSIMSSVGMIIGYSLAGFGIGIGILGSKIARLYPLLFKVLVYSTP